MWATSSHSGAARHCGSPIAADADEVKGAAQLFRAGNEIHFRAGITYDTVHSLLKVLKEAEAESLAAARAGAAKVDALGEAEKKLVDVKVTPKPLVLFITSYGGVIYAALSAADAIARLEVPVHTVVSGYVASAGTLISLAGARRFITPHSFMMVHELRGGFWGRYSDVRVEGENMEKLMALIVRYYARRSKLPEATTLLRDRNWDADECVVYGLVDEVLQAPGGEDIVADKKPTGWDAV